MTTVPGALPRGQSRQSLVAEVTRALDAVPARSRVIVALSGGADSTALAHLSAASRPDLELSLVHVRHGLRDDAADAAVASQHAALLGLDLAVEAVRVEVGRDGPEAAARRARYAALDAAAARAGADHILVGHSADDQAETLVQRLARGTGTGGLAGMRSPAPLPVAGVDGRIVLRPLLRLRRADLRDLVVSEGLPTVEDPTNQDLRHARNRVRQRVLPAIGGLGGDPVASLTRLADLAAADRDALEAWTDRAEARLVRRYGPIAAVSRADLAALPTAIAARLVARLLVAQRGDGARPVHARELARVLDLAPGQLAHVGAAVASCGGGWLAVGRCGLPPPAAVALDPPGRVRWDALGLTILADTPDSLPAVQPTLDGVWHPSRPPVDPDLVPPGGNPAAGHALLGAPGVGADPARAVVRPRRPGDRLRRPAGSRTVARVMLDAGVPRLLRDLLPVVAVDDRVLWIPGVAVDAGAAAVGDTHPSVRLRLARR